MPIETPQQLFGDHKRLILQVLCDATLPCKHLELFLIYWERVFTRPLDHVHFEVNIPCPVGVELRGGIYVEVFAYRRMSSSRNSCV